MEQQPGDSTQSVSRPWMPVVAGAMSITAGAMGFIAATIMVTFVTIFGPGIAPDVMRSVGYWLVGLPVTIVGIAAFFILIISTLAIVGGVCALRRKIWGLALTGAVCAIFPVQILGVVSVVFIAISKKEFD